MLINGLLFYFECVLFIIYSFECRMRVWKLVMVAIAGALAGADSQRALSAGGNTWNLLTLIR